MKMSSPWRTENWSVSPFNFDPQIVGTERPKPPVLHDVTLRDGEENAGLVFSHEDKLVLAKALDAAGLSRIEVLLTTPGAEESTKAILDLGLKAEIHAAGSLIKPSNMEIAVRCKVQKITMGIRTSDLQIQTFAGKPREAVLEQYLNAVETAKSHDMDVNLFLADCPRAELSFLEEVVGRCVEADVDAVTVVDSVGTATPQTIAYLVRTIKQWTDLPIEVHTHNDFGLGMATSLAGWVAGAEVIHVAVNSLGYRCGNPATEEMTLTLEALYGVDTGVNLERLYELSLLAQEASGLSVYFGKPLSGPGAFGYERYAQIKKAHEMNMPEAFYPYRPEAVGREPLLLLSKWSDVDMVKHKLSEMGYEVSDEVARQILKRVKQLAVEKKRPLNDEEVRSLAEFVQV
jgi:isopropylmalate/homocitrate/citramalate synthase